MALWDLDDEGDEFEARTAESTCELVESHRETCGGVLEQRGDPWANGLVMAARSTGAWWRLWPGLEADFAAVLLRNPELCDVQRAHIAVHHEIVDEQVTRYEAELELRAWWRKGVLGVPVEGDTLPADVRRLLERARSSGYAFAATPDASLPAVFERCVEQLRLGDLAWIVEQPGAWYLRACVFVGPDDQPCFDPRTPGESMLRDRDLDVMTLREQLETLAGYWLIARVECEGASRYLRLRPDRIWLWEGADRTSGRQIHHSIWTLEVADEPIAGDVEPRRIRATMTLQRSTYLTRDQAEERGDSDLLIKLALTPVTLSVDLLFWWLHSLVFPDDDLDDELERTSRRRRSR